MLRHVALVGVGWGGGGVGWGWFLEGPFPLILYEVCIVSPYSHPQDAACAAE